MQTSLVDKELCVSMKWMCFRDKELALVDDLRDLDFQPEVHFELWLVKVVDAQERSTMCKRISSSKD